VHGTIRTIHTTHAAALKITTHPKTRCRKPYAATQHLMLLMWAYIPETCRAKNTSIKLPSCIKLAFHFISRERCMVKQPSTTTKIVTDGRLSRISCCEISTNQLQSNFPICRPTHAFPLVHQVLTRQRWDIYYITYNSETSCYRADLPWNVYTSIKAVAQRTIENHYICYSKTRATCFGF